MAFRRLSGLFATLLISLPLWADDIRLNPSHPETYTVVPGDTLWHLAGRFLQRPEQWPLIWQNNPQINNPHLIYPGDTLAFAMIDGQPQISLAEPSETRLKKLSPRVRESSIEEAILMVPSEQISSYLSSSRIIDEEELQESPYVIAFGGEHLIAGSGDKIYVRAIEDADTLHYAVYRPGKTYISPETEEIIGHEAKYIARATLQKEGDPATLTITEASSEIRRGDKVLPYQDRPFMLNYFPRQPESAISGSIIGVLDGLAQVGRYNVVVIDKGSEEGLEIGHVLDIYQKGKTIDDKFGGNRNDAVTLPDEIAGTLMVFQAFEHVSYAVVMESYQAINLFDKVQTP